VLQKITLEPEHASSKYLNTKWLRNRASLIKNNLETQIANKLVQWGIRRCWFLAKNVAGGSSKTGSRNTKSAAKVKPRKQT
jgi:hypothetical protein